MWVFRANFEIFHHYCKQKCLKNLFFYFFLTEAQSLSLLNDWVSVHFQSIIPDLLLQYLHLRYESPLRHIQSRVQEVFIYVSWNWCISAEKCKEGVFHAVRLQLQAKIFLLEMSINTNACCVTTEWLEKSFYFRCSALAEVNGIALMYDWRTCIWRPLSHSHYS